MSSCPHHATSGHKNTEVATSLVPIQPGNEARWLLAQCEDCVCVCVCVCDLVQWLGVDEVSAKAGVLESILVGQCGTVQMGLHCTE